MTRKRIRHPRNITISNTTASLPNPNRALTRNQKILLLGSSLLITTGLLIAISNQMDISTVLIHQIKSLNFNGSSHLSNFFNPITQRIFPSSIDNIIDKENNIKQLIEKQITIGESFKKEIALNLNSNNKYLKIKYSKINFDQYTKKIKTELEHIFLNTHFANLLKDATHFSIEPTGAMQVIAHRENDAFTSFAEKIIFINIAVFEHKTKFELSAILANELQHISVVNANEKRYHRQIDLEDEETVHMQYGVPFQTEKEQSTYISTIKTCFQKLIVNVDLNKYLYSTNNKKRETFQTYFQQLIGYNLEICSELRNNAYKKGYIKQSSLNYQNPYARAKLSLEKQIWELDSSIASIFVLLHRKDQWPFDDWVNYHQKYPTLPEIGTLHNLITISDEKMAKSSFGQGSYTAQKLKR